MRCKCEYEIEAPNLVKAQAYVIEAVDMWKKVNYKSTMFFEITKARKANPNEKRV